LEIPLLTGCHMIHNACIKSGWLPQTETAMAGSAAAELSWCSREHRHIRTAEPVGVASDKDRAACLECRSMAVAGGEYL
jgi:hypothetical protein